MGTLMPHDVTAALHRQTGGGGLPGAVTQAVSCAGPPWASGTSHVSNVTEGHELCVFHRGEFIVVHNKLQCFI